MYTQSKSKRAISVLLLFSILATLLVGTTAWFTDRTSASADGTAGTLTIKLDDSGINLLDADGKDILNPGDMRDYKYTVTNTGNKSADIKETITLTAYDKNGNALNLSDTQSEFEIYNAADVKFVENRGYMPNDGAEPLQVKSLADNIITYEIPVYTLNGSTTYSDNQREIEPDVDSDTHASDYVLVFKGAASNAFQAAVLKLDLVVEAKQHRNTENVLWSEVATSTHILSNGNQVAVVPGAVAVNPSEDFITEVIGNGEIKITGLTDTGANKETLVIPSVLQTESENYKVTEIDWEQIFADSNNTKINNNDPNIPQPADDLVFNYESDGSTTTITGLTDDGKKLTYVKFPETMNGEDTTLDSGVIDDATNSDTDLEIPDSVIEDISASGLYTYTVDSSNNATITGLTDLASSLKLNGLDIPTEIDGYPVTGLARSAFSNKTNVSGTLNIPSTVTYVGSNLINNTNISTVNIDVADGTTFENSNGYMPWMGSNATEINYTNENLTVLPAYAFAQATETTSYSYPSSVTAISEGAFEGCTSLTSIDLTGIETIGNNAFRNAGLTSLEIPDSVTYIGQNAFAGCTGLNGTLDIPASIEYIGYYFLNNTNIETVNMDVTDNASLAGEIFNGSKATEINYTNASLTKLPNNAFYGAANMTSYSYPDTVTSIGDSAFYGCTSLSSVDLTGIETIGNNAFRNAGLTSLEIPDSVTYIGQNAFAGCTGLNGTLDIPASVTNIGGYAFNKTNYATINVDVADGAVIDGNAFTGTKATEINYTNASLTTLPANAFANATNMTSYSYPDTVTSIGDYAFYNCTSLSSVDLAGITSVGNYALAKSAITSIDLTGVQTIGNNAFQSSWLNGSLVIPDGVTSIGSYAFASTGITEATIADSVTSIGGNAFSNCSSLITINYKGTASGSPWGSSATIVTE